MCHRLQVRIWMRRNLVTSSRTRRNRNQRRREFAAAVEQGRAALLALNDDALHRLLGWAALAGSSEIAIHRKRMPNDTTPLIGALKTDDNTFPKHLRSFMLRGRPFQQFGPNDYALAHLLDHKDDKSGLDRLNHEIAHPEQLQLNTPRYGLFTSAANTVYLPRALIRPTDCNHSLRTLIQRRAQQLYGAVCNLVPYPWTIRESADSAWSPEAFTWVG
jgi:hypothetical protein